MNPAYRAEVCWGLFRYTHVRCAFVLSRAIVHLAELAVCLSQTTVTRTYIRQSKRFNFLRNEAACADGRSRCNKACILQSNTASWQRAYDMIVVILCSSPPVLRARNG